MSHQSKYVLMPSILLLRANVNINQCSFWYNLFCGGHVLATKVVSRFVFVTNHRYRMRFNSSTIILTLTFSEFLCKNNIGTWCTFLHWRCTANVWQCLQIYKYTKWGDYPFNDPLSIFFILFFFLEGGGLLLWIFVHDWRTWWTLRTIKVTYIVLPYSCFDNIFYSVIWRPKRQQT